MRKFYFRCQLFLGMITLANKFIEYCETDDPPEEQKPKKTKCSSCGVECPAAKKKARGGFKPLDVGNIKRALTHFSVDFSDANADAVFKSGNGKVGQRSARQLRNEYAHSLSLRSREEIAQRSVDLIGLMMHFCTAVKNRISGV